MYGLKLGLICNISFEKQAEIIELFTGVRISRNRLYTFSNEHYDLFVEYHQGLIKNELRRLKIKNYIIESKSQNINITLLKQFPKNKYY